MPQFDKITFFTQIFWLTVIFFGFYFLILQIFLPKIAAVLKSRKKKLALGSSGVFSLNKEHFSAANARNIFIQNFVEGAKKVLGSKLLLGASWLLLYSTDSNNKKLTSSQLKYLEIYGNMFAKQYLTNKSTSI